MSVTSMNERFQERTAQKEMGKKTATRSFQATTNNVNDDALTVIDEGIASWGLPDTGADHPNDPTLWATSITPRPEGDAWGIWLVVVKYELKPSDIPPGSGTDPWDLDPVISFSYSSRQKVFDKAYSYNETIAAAGATRDEPKVDVVNMPFKQPFDPPAMIEDYIMIIAIQRNIIGSAFNPDDIRTYQNTINKEVITVAGISLPVFTGFLRDFKAQKRWTDDQIDYWAETFEILVDPQTWIKRISNMGVFQAVESGGTPTSPGNLVKYRKNLDTDGDAIRDPIRIGLAGKPLGFGDPSVYLEYHGIWEQDWAGLNLPATY